MPDINKIKDDYYIIATSSVIDPFRLVLKQGDLFGVFDRFGDILPIGRKEEGLYYKGTRFLSYFEAKINGIRPLFLSSDIEDDNILLTVDLSNPDLYNKEKLLYRRDSVHIMRSRLLLDNRCVERVNAKNFSREKMRFSLELSFDNDFKDIFEVRGFKRKSKGKSYSHAYKDGELVLKYEGADGVKRTTLIRGTRPPDSVKEKTFAYKIELEPDSSAEFEITIECLIDAPAEPGIKFDAALLKSRKRLRDINKGAAEIHSSNQQFNESIERSLSDINMMLTETEHGLYPYGGIPWFCTPFGRDGIITALECIWINPGLARGVLGYLASMQAKDFDKKRASEPGKIFHETRTGELAKLDEIPFGLYYGSVDSTPLFIILAGAYWRRTGDTPFIKRLWPAIESAVLWMEKYGDADGDGFIEYAPDKTGLRNQGWKDSQDSIFHNDGTLAEGPIALTEVQGYAYAARREASLLAGLLGKKDLSERLEKDAASLKKNFNHIFWDEPLGTYVLALDGDKRPCSVIASNAGHSLFSGIADPEKAAKVAKTLTSPEAFSGWGIRTAALSAPLYNPMSYHNGSVWPHDNALIASGFASYGLKEHFSTVFSALFEASLFMEFHRLPELFCGFSKRNGSAPTLYPVACSPQTWASGSLLLMLQASLGILFEASEENILFKQPWLPEFLDHVCLKNLYVSPGKTVDLFIKRYGKGVTIEVLNKPEGVGVQIFK